MDPCHLVPTLQADGATMRWEMFSWCTLSPLVPTEQRLHGTAYLSIVAEHDHPFYDHSVLMGVG